MTTTTATASKVSKENQVIGSYFGEIFAFNNRYHQSEHRANGRWRLSAGG